MSRRDLGQRLERRGELARGARRAMSGERVAHRRPTRARAPPPGAARSRGPAAARADAAGEPLEVAHAAERVAQRRRAAGPLDQLLDRVEAPADRRGLEQRAEQPLAQPARAHRRARLVEHPEQRAAALAAERLQELEVPARRRVELRGSRRARTAPAAREVRGPPRGRPRRRSASAPPRRARRERAERRSGPRRPPAARARGPRARPSGTRRRPSAGRSGASSSSRGARRVELLARRRPSRRASVTRNVAASRSRSTATPKRVAVGRERREEARRAADRGSPPR